MGPGEGVLSDAVIRSKAISMVFGATVSRESTFFATTKVLPTDGPVTVIFEPPHPVPTTTTPVGTLDKSVSSNSPI